MTRLQSRSTPLNKTNVMQFSSNIAAARCIRDITLRREDVNFMFTVLARKYCSCMEVGGFHLRELFK